jgi:L-fuconolactonase
VTAVKRRFVDPHMHLWDVGANPWYRFPVPGNDFGLGLQQPFPDTYVLNDYLESMTVVDLKKCVHVTAVTGPQDVAAEGTWITNIARSNNVIRAVVGTVDLRKPRRDIEATLNNECAHPLYRGIRLLEGLDYEGPLGDALLRTLASRGLVYDAVAHSDGSIAAAAKGLRRHEDLVVVLEHTGWPIAVGEGAFEAWHREMKLFAELPNTFCKLSGLGMVVHSTDLEVFQAYFRASIELFGPDRCMFASNFPVDLAYGSSADLFAVFESVARGYGEDEAAMLFERTAEHVYKI